MRRPGVLVAVALWVLTVAVVASLTWVAIGRAGRGVATGPLPVASDATQPPPGPSSATTGRLPSPSPGSEIPEAPAGSSSHRPASPSHPAGSSTARPPSTPAAARASRSTAGGTVSAECRDSRLSLRSVVPNVGYRVESEPHDGGVEVKFEPNDGADGGEVKVQVRCSSGRPVFGVTAKASGDDSGGDDRGGDDSGGDD